MKKSVKKTKQIQHDHREQEFNEAQKFEGSRDDEQLTSDDLNDIPEPVQPEPTPELEAILQVLQQGGEKILSIREHQAFQLVVREGRSEATAAELMGCSRRAVRTHVRRAGVKLRKLCQPWL